MGHPSKFGKSQWGNYIKFAYFLALFVLPFPAPNHRDSNLFQFITVSKNYRFPGEFLSQPFSIVSFGYWLRLLLFFAIPFH
jgi:hypothetical protein